VPELVVNGAASSALEHPFMIVRAIKGETIARKILRDDEFSAARPQLAAQIGTALAELHRIDPATIPGLEVEDQIQRFKKVLHDLGEPHPVFEVAFRWLEKNRPESQRQSVVHGDFRLGNLMVDSNGLVSVLDWELAHVGDPMEDLGWVCVKAWRFGGAQPVAGIGSYEEMFNAYEATSGIRPELSVVRWWEILGTLKWGIMCIMQASRHTLGMVRSHELAAIGRRVCENEYDLVVMLEELLP
jgi:aminoglycoside phosphotransferase (APT) family kinase protein